MNTIEILTWKEVKQHHPALGSETVALINTLPKANELKLIKVSYPYCEKIVDNGRFQVYDGKAAIPLELYENERVQTLLNYDWQITPLGLICNHMLEYHLEHAGQSMPFSQKKAQELVGTGNAKHRCQLTNSLCSIYAGSRSMMLLSKITNKALLQRLRLKYQVDFDHPRDFEVHAPIFKALAYCHKMNSPWSVDILFFSKGLVEELKRTTQFKQRQIDDLNLNASDVTKSQPYDILWSTAIKKMKQNKILTSATLQDPFIITSAKKIISIACCESLGYAPVTSTLPGPTKEILKVFSEDYKIRHKYPTLMSPALYTKEQPIYYTTANPNHIIQAPDLGYRRQTICDLHYIKSAVDWFRHYFLDSFDNTPMSQTQFFHDLKSAHIDYYHPKGSAGINCDISQLTQSDPRFDYWPLDSDRKGELDTNSQFFHGCIKISHQ